MYYVCKTLLGWTDEAFILSTPKHISKQLKIHIDINNQGENKNNNAKSNSSNNSESEWTSFTVIE